MKKIYLIFLLVISLFIFYSCTNLLSNTGTVKLSITDSPIDGANIKGVYIDVTGISYSMSTGDTGWTKLDLKEEKLFNLLEFTNGDAKIMGNFNLPAGKINQIRFFLDTNKSFIKFSNDSTTTLSIPSGDTTGYKATISGGATIPVNGQIEITADFDVRKSLNLIGNGLYKLQPTIRLIVNNQAGVIKGQITDASTDTTVFAYSNNSYNTSDIEFSSAINSSRLRDNGTFELHYLSAGTYDLVFAKFTTDGTLSLLGGISNIEVKSNQITNVPTTTINNLENVSIW
ncbi:hypothetical protein OSSY52_06680 [Tepiditoga spiralis]|uniref:DUF4382 domain-containing protein n=1 Tax=Tepiditoga spiralis TaxID=2108365 RepID=A0A7G1G6L2_9BACT|nr:DUF4382 domain-containing protein [Tepiditoga spiralis]BBE30527.1 hypothetical protein OSSY52_06680 [Tepiditoga spiralis]